MTPEELASYIPLKCPLNFFLGIDCPTCGLGRSICALILGDFRKSLQYHSLGPAVFFASIGVVIHLLKNWASDRIYARTKKA